MNLLFMESAHATIGAALGISRKVIKASEKLSTALITYETAEKEEAAELLDRLGLKEN